MLVSSLAGKNVVMVAAGNRHSLALTQDHHVYSCGYNSEGQLGLNEERNIVTNWTHVEKLAGKRICRIYAGY